MNEQNNSSQNPNKRLVSSSLVWTLVFLFAADYALETIQPFKYVSNWKYRPLNHNPVVSKIPKFLNGKDNADVLIMGCSLPMTAIAAYDEKYIGVPKVEDVEALRTYTQARYLQSLFQQKRVENAKIYNLTCVGCMASDADLLLTKTLALKKKPDLIVYGIGPRSFVDNTISENTAISQVLTSWKSLPDIVDPKMSWSQRGDIIISSLWRFYSDKNDYRNFLSALSCDKTDRCPTIFAASQRYAAEKAQGKQLTMAEPAEAKLEEVPGKVNDKLKVDLALYNMRYNPPNFAQFEDQKIKFENFAKRCKQENIKLLVVAMPLTEQNQDLLDRKLLQKYTSELPQISQQNEAAYLDLNDGKTFLPTDFEDSVHTNASGGKKVQDKIVGALSDKQWL